MTIKVAIVDDQALVRSGLSMILNQDARINVVAECGNGEDAIACAKTQNPDVMLMDIRMPQMDGLEATEKIIHELKSDVRILVLSTFDLDEYVFKALQLGASGFLLKDTPPEQLISAVISVAAGGALLSPSVTKTLISNFATYRAVDSKTADKLKDLTTRETEILQHLAKGLNNVEIGESLFIGEATVKTHVSNVLSKLGLRDRAQAVVFAYESGLIQAGSSV